MTTIENKDLVRNHANRHITYLLNQLKFPYFDNARGLIQARCPCLQHGGDRNNSSAFSWRIDIGRWICWTHHCEDKFGSDIFGLVRSRFNYNFYQAFNWVIQKLETKHIDYNEEMIVSKYRSTLHVHEPLSEDHLKFLQPDPQYLINRGFDINILREYETGFWGRPGTYMYDRVIFPIRDHDGFLVGYTGRTVHNEDYFLKRNIQYKKWIHGRHYSRYPKSGEIFTSSLLFNLCKAKRHLNPHKKIVLIEGPLDGMRLQEAQIYNWVATLGTHFCHLHRSLLIKYGITDLYVAYDNDDPTKYQDGISPSMKAWESLQKVVGDLIRLHKIDPPIGKDWGDLSALEVKEYFKCLN